jgi:hypothetical protein
MIFFFLQDLIGNKPYLGGVNMFKDVPNDHWAYDAVNMLEVKGIVEGYPDNLFKGDNQITRYEMSMIVARLVAKLESIQASNMNDLKNLEMTIKENMW